MSSAASGDQVGDMLGRRGSVSERGKGWAKTGLPHFTILGDTDMADWGLGEGSTERGNEEEKTQACSPMPLMPGTTGISVTKLHRGGKGIYLVTPRR